MATTFTIDLTTLPALLAVLGPGQQLGLFTVDGVAWTAAISPSPIGFAPPPAFPDLQSAYAALTGAVGAQAAAYAKNATTKAVAINTAVPGAVPIGPGQPDQPAVIKGTP